MTGTVTKMWWLAYALSGIWCIMVDLTHYLTRFLRVTILVTVAVSAVLPPPSALLMQITSDVSRYTENISDASNVEGHTAEEQIQEVANEEEEKREEKDED